MLYSVPGGVMAWQSEKSSPDVKRYAFLTGLLVMI